MLENLRRKSLVKTYIDSIHQVHFEQGHVVYLDSFSLEQHKQRLSKKNQEKSFPSTFDGVSKGFRLISHALGKVKFNMIACPSGTFEMGHTSQTDNQPRQETIEMPFLLGETEITQELYEEVIRYNPSRFENKFQKPVENVSWYDTIEFCNELSRLHGLEQCYILTDISTKDERGRDCNCIMSAQVTCDFNRNGYRLPTEKEWEYAAKAGTQNRWAGTDDETKLGKYAWFGKDYNKGSTQLVKSKKPNEWGFYDMSGNVFEWCWDKYDSDNTNLDAKRVVRGGSWESNNQSLYSAFRYDFSPINLDKEVGFRVARSLVN